MTPWIRHTVGLMVLISLSILSILPIGNLPRAHGLGQAFSTIYISPVTTCCLSPSSPFHIGDGFGIDVKLNLASGQSINGFDVRINYTSPHSGISQGVLQAQSIDYSNNMFSSPSYSTNVLEECIDGRSIPSSGTGCTTDSLGQVRLGEFILGKTISGPINGAQLFHVLFTITGNGTSTFQVDRADVVNPIADSSSPGQVSPQDIPVLRKAAIFGNIGVVAFFDYQLQDMSLSPSIIPNNPVIFDASAAFEPSNSSMLFHLYSWNFGDGTASENRTSSSDIHYFALPGNYTVSLKIWDSHNVTGTYVRRVSVSTALGNLDLTVQDTTGNLQMGVQVRVYNASTFPTPFFNRTTNGLGGVRFNGMTPGNYYLTFSGPGLQSGSKTETVIPGFTLQDTVHLSPVPSPPDYSGIIYIGTILGGLAIVTIVIVYQRAKMARKSERNRVRSSVKSRS
jgi:hypothetical protein